MAFPKRVHADGRVPMPARVFEPARDTERLQLQLAAREVTGGLVIFRRKDHQEVGFAYIVDEGAVRRFRFRGDRQLCSSMIELLARAQLVLARQAALRARLERRLAQQEDAAR